MILTAYEHNGQTYCTDCAIKHGRAGHNGERPVYGNQAAQCDFCTTNNRLRLIEGGQNE